MAGMISCLRQRSKSGRNRKVEASGETVKRLHATLGKMELALGSINEAIVWTDRDGSIQWCNSAFDRLAGLPHIFILGKALTDLLPLNRRGQLVQRDDHPIATLMRHGGCVDEIYDFDSTGKTLCLDISGRRVTAGEDLDILILSIRNVTELTLSRQALEKAKQTLEQQVESRTRKLLEITDQYKSILSEAVDAILTIDPDGLIQSFNPAAEKIFGYKEEEAVGQNVTLIIPAPFKHEHNQYIRNYLETGKENIIGIGREVAGVHRSGRQIPLYLGVSVVRLKDRIIFTGVLRDITAQKKAEQALKQARDEAESANKAKSAFLANMSHEIRTPMNAVLGFSELLTPLVSEGKQKQYLEAIMSSGKGLLTIINDILDLSKIEAGKLDMTYAPVDIRMLLEEIRQIFIPVIKEKGLGFDITFGNGDDKALGASFALMLDEIRIRQILLNLVGNAVKFTSRGKITLSADFRPDGPEERRNARGKGELMIRVTDTGVGIPKDRQEMIFKAFEQQETNTARDYGGTGLGLTITRRLAGMMNGSLSLESKEGRGSEFRVVLKDVSLAEPLLAEEKTGRANRSKKRFKPATILVVDDVASNRYLIREMISATELRVLEADCGQTGLDMIRQESPNLLVLDIRMPGMDGHEVLKAVRGNPDTATLPVICMTASVNPVDLAEADEGFDLVLPKPVERAELISGLSRFLPCRDGSSESDFEADRQVPGAGTISPAKKPAELARALKRLEDEQWFAIDGVLEMDRVEEFGKTLAALAGKYNAPDLAVYAEELITAAEGFDIIRVRAGLKKFTELMAGYAYRRRERTLMPPPKH